MSKEDNLWALVLSIFKSWEMPILCGGCDKEKRQDVR